MTSGTRRSMPSESGIAFRKPDPCAAFAISGRLQTAPVARNAGNSTLLAPACTIGIVNGESVQLVEAAWPPLKVNAYPTMT